MQSTLLDHIVRAHIPVIDDTCMHTCAHRYVFLGGGLVEQTLLDQLSLLERPFADEGNELSAHDALWGQACARPLPLAVPLTPARPSSLSYPSPDLVWQVLGSNGASFYRSSLKLALFSAVGSLAFFGAGGYGDTFSSDAANAIVGFAVHALASGSGSEAVVAALEPSLAVLISIVTWLPSMSVIALTPITLIGFSWATSVT